MNILITGGLGYLGMSLCELYENSKHCVVVADDRSFCQYNTLPWNVKYHKRDLFDCRDLLSSAKKISVPNCSAK